MNTRNDDGRPEGEPGELSEIIASYLEAVERGETPDREELLRRHPPLAAELASFLDDHDRLRDMASSPETLPLGVARANIDLIRYFGDYELLDEIARGGMGVVYRARQRTLNRVVAVKTILAGELASDEDVTRFRAEAEAAAALDHSSIVPIYEIGTHEGRHYFSMAFIDGTDLGKLIRENPLPSRRAAGYVAQIADAIQFAHDHGTIHRDLKPSNIIIDRDDKPHITDFGLAKRLDATATLTGTGQILGTASYMPPEQAAGSRRVGPRSDVYALGAILYELVTSRPPFKGETTLGTLQQVLDPGAIPVAPRHLNPAVEPDLDTIIRKCLEKEPGRRYGSARDLAEELGRFLRHEPIVARPQTNGERAWRWCRRNPVVSTLGSATAALVVVTAIVSTIGYLATSSALAREATARADAQVQRDGALEQTELARRHLYGAEMLLAHAAWEGGDLDRMYELLVHHREPNGPEPRGFEWGYLWNLGSTDHELLSKRELDPIRVQLNSSGDILMAAGHDGVKLWDMATHRVSREISEGRTMVVAAAMTQDGQRIALGLYTGEVHVWNAATAELLHELGTAMAVARTGPTARRRPAALAFSPDGSVLAAGYGGGQRTVTIYDAVTGRVVHDLTGPAYGVGAIDFSADGSLLVAADGIDGSLHLWSTSSWSELATTEGSPGLGAEAIALSPDGRRLAVGRKALGSQPGKIELRELPSLSATYRTVVAGPGTVHSLAYSPDGSTIAAGVGAGKGLIALMDAGTGEVSKQLLGHFRGVASVAFTPDGDSLISCGSRDHTLRLWSLDGAQEYEELATTSGAASAATYLPSGELVTAGRTEDALATVSVLGPTDLRPLRTFEEPRFFVVALAASPDGRLLAAGGGFNVPDGTHGGGVEVWDLTTGESVRSITSYQDAVDTVAFSPDGARLALGSRDRQIRVVDIGSGAELWSLDLPPRSGALAYLDEATILLGSGPELLLIDAATGTTRRTIEADRFATGCIAVAPDGRTVALGGTSVQIWDAVTWTRRHLLTGHSELVTAVTFSPDGSRLASGGIDALVKLWDVETGQEMLSLLGHTTSITTLAFAPDGSSLVSVGRVTPAGGESLLWRSTTFDPTATPAGFRGRRGDDRPPRLPASRPRRAGR